MANLVHQQMTMLKNNFVDKLDPQLVMQTFRTAAIVASNRDELSQSLQYTIKETLQAI